MATTNTAVMALRVFNRNLDGQMIVGNPNGRTFGARYPMVSEGAAASLEAAGLGKIVSRSEYFDAQVAFDAEQEGGDRPLASDIRLRRTGGPGASAGANRNADKPSVTMSKVRLRELATLNGKVDMAAFDEAKNNKERVALIDAASNGSGDGADTRSATGRVAASSAASTNHPAASTPHADGLGAQEDQAPLGGGGASA